VVRGGGGDSCYVLLGLLRMCDFFLFFFSFFSFGFYFRPDSQPEPEGRKIRRRMTRGSDWRFETYGSSSAPAAARAPAESEHDATTRRWRKIQAARVIKK